MHILTIRRPLGITALLSGVALGAMPAMAEQAEPVRLAALDTIVVVGQKQDYRTKDSRTATKTDTPLQDVPQAVSVVTAQQIADQGLHSMTEVLRTVPGATVASGEGHRDQILLRGQNTTADFFVDGLRDDSQYYRGLYNLDRVEVLKGPNAMIFGRGGGGGVVNRVTKKADSSRTFLGGALSVDSNGAWSGAIDGNASLGNGLGGRINAVYETFDSFRDHVDGHRIGINPTIGWDLGESTSIDLSYEYSRDRRTVDRGVPSENGRPWDGNYDQFFGDPDVNKMRFDGHVGDLAVEHRFGDTLRWTGKARVGTTDKLYTNAFAATPVAADGTVGIEAYLSGADRDFLQVQNDFVGEVETGAIRHTLLAGVDYSWAKTHSIRQQGFFDSAPLAETASSRRRLIVSLANSDSLYPITFRDGATAATDGRTEATAWGIYVQDQARIGEHVEVIAGLRRDWFDLDYRNLISGAELSRKDALWSPRLGLVVKPMPSLSLYASWSRSFLPQSGDQFSSLTVDTAALKPEKFLNREVGVKWAATPTLDVTLAAYVLDRTNTRATDPVTQLTVLTGEQRSKGIEASVTGKVTKHLSIAAAAALQKAEITRTTTAAPAGREVASVPHFTGSLWGRYDINERLGLGAGIYHQSKMYASISNAVTVPGYTRLDAAAFFALTNNIEAQVNVENLLDKKYIGLVHTDNNLNPGSPRTLKAALRFKL